MPRDPAPGLILAWEVIPSGSMPIEIGRCSGRSHRPGVRPWYAFDHAGPVGGGVKSHCSRSGVRLQCYLMPKALPKRAISAEKERCKRTTLMRFGEMHGTGVRALDVDGGLPSGPLFVRLCIMLFSRWSKVVGGGVRDLSLSAAIRFAKKRRLTTMVTQTAPGYSLSKTACLNYYGG